MLRLIVVARLVRAAVIGWIIGWFAWHVVNAMRPGPSPCEAPANHGRECQSCERLRSQWASVDDEARAIVDSCEKE
jgi:hypothetical protein